MVTRKFSAKARQQARRGHGFEETRITDFRIEFV
jgi:hypothetical protein